MVVLLSVFGNEVLDEFRRDIAGDAAGDEHGQGKIIGCRIVFVIYLFNIGIDEIAADFIVRLFFRSRRHVRLQIAGHGLPRQPGHVVEVSAYLPLQGMPGLAAAKEALPFARRHPAAATGTGNEAFQLVSLLPLGLGETELDHFFPQPFCQMGRFLADTGYRIVIISSMISFLYINR